MESFGATAGAQLAPFIAGLRDVIAALAQAPKGVRVFIVAAGALAAAIGPVVAVVGLFALALGAVAAPVAAVVAGLALGAAVLVALWPDIEAGAAQLRDALGRAASAVSDGAARGVAAMRRLVAEVLSVIRAGFDRAIASAQRVAAQVADAFERLYVRVVGNSSVPDMVDGVLDRMGGLKADGVRSAGEAASVIEASVQSLGEAVAGQFASAARGGGFDVRQIAGAFVGAIVSGAASSLSNAAIGALSPQGVTQAAPAPDFSFGASTFPATDIPARGAPFTQPGAAQPARRRPRSGAGRRGSWRRASKVGHGPEHAAPPPSGIHPLPQRARARHPSRQGCPRHPRQVRRETRRSGGPSGRRTRPTSTPRSRAGLERHPRWTFHFTPTSASWLNAVEGFFAKLTRRISSFARRRPGSVRNDRQKQGDQRVGNTGNSEETATPAIARRKLWRCARR